MNLYDVLNMRRVGLCQRRMGLFTCPAAFSRRDFMGGSLSIGLISSYPIENDDVETHGTTSLPPPPANRSERWLRNGPYTVRSLPTLEHTCSRCFPSCSGTSCLLRILITYPQAMPQAMPQAGNGPPFPLAIICSGFLLSSSLYQSYSDMLASHGWTVLRYDRQETLVDYLDDETCAEGIVDIIDWAASDALIRRLADTRTVYLIGHSRGGKLAALASSRDRRVKGLFLIDPVDYHPVYQPISPGFPSSIAALQQSESPVSVAVVGSGRAGDCAPEASNFNRFFEASTGRALSIEVEQAGHFAFLDDQPLQSLVCPGSDIASGESGVFDPQTAGILARAVMVAWGELLTSSQEQVVGKSPEEKPRLPSVLPTWSTRDLPQFQEDTLGPRATQEEKSRALEAQKRAIEGRRRFTSGQASGQVPSSEQVLSDGQITEVVDAERIADDLKALINETKKGGAWRGELKLKGFNHGS